jgi:hypothetical protein
MDQAINQFWHWGTVGLAVLVVIGTFFVRRIIETAVPSVKAQKDGTYKTKFALWWNSVLLYSIPIVVGAGLGLVGSYYEGSLPESIKTHVGGLFFGVIIGWFSSFIYKVLRKVLKKKTGIDPGMGPVTDPSPPPKDEDDKEEKKDSEPPESKKDKEEKKDSEPPESKKDEDEKKDSEPPESKKVEDKDTNPDK